MEHYENYSRAKWIYAATWVYLLVMFVPGPSFREAAFSFLLPLVHTVLGYWFFAPFGDMQNSKAAMILGTTVVVVLCLFALLGYVFKIQRYRKISAFVGRFLRFYISIFFWMVYLEALIAGALVGPVFFVCALLLLGTHLWGAGQWLNQVGATDHRPRRVMWLSLAAGLAAVVLFGMFRAQLIFLLILYLCLSVYLVVSIVLSGRKGSPGPVATMNGMKLCCAACGAAAVGYFWSAPSDCSRQALLKSGVRTIIAPEKWPGEELVMRPYDTVIAPGSHRMFIAYKIGALEEYDLRNKRSMGRVMMREFGWRKGSTQRLTYNTRTGDVFSTFWRAPDDIAVAVFSSAPLKFKKALQESKCPAIDLEIDHKTQSLVVLCEAYEKVLWFDYRTLAKTDVLHLPEFSQPHAVRLDDGHRKIYVDSGSMSRFLYEIDADTHRITRRAYIGFTSLGMVLDPGRRRAYLSKPFSSKVMVVDLDSMKILKSLQARPGVRDLDIDPERRRLYAGNYISGTVQVFDLKTDRMLREYYVGKQVRGVYHSRELNRDFASSSCGVMELKH